MQGFERRRAPQRDAMRRAKVVLYRKDRTAFASSRAAEEAACAHLIALGVSDAEVTGPGADGGIDVIATSVVAQVKDHAIPTGRPVVQQTLGVATSLDRRAAVYATGGFTAAAVHFADDTGVALFKLHVDQPATPCSQLACHLVGRRAEVGTWTPGTRQAQMVGARTHSADRMARAHRARMRARQRRIVLSAVAAICAALIVALVRVLP